MSCPSSSSQILRGKWFMSPLHLFLHCAASATEEWIGPTRVVRKQSKKDPQGSI